MREERVLTIHSPTGELRGTPPAEGTPQPNSAALCFRSAHRCTRQGHATPGAPWKCPAHQNQRSRRQDRGRALGRGSLWDASKPTVTSGPEGRHSPRCLGPWQQRSGQGGPRPPGMRPEKGGSWPPGQGRGPWAPSLTCFLYPARAAGDPTDPLPFYQIFLMQ